MLKGVAFVVLDGRLSYNKRVGQLLQQHHSLQNKAAVGRGGGSSGVVAHRWGRVSGFSGSGGGWVAAMLVGRSTKCI